MFPKVIYFDSPLEEAYIIKREKRFFVEFTWGSPIENYPIANDLAQNPITQNQEMQESLTQSNLTENQSLQESFWAHTNNTGSMMGLIQKGRRILLSKANNPKRKLAWTLEAICIQSELLDSNLNSDLLSQGESLCKESPPKKSPHKKSPWLGVNTSLPNKFLHALFFMKDENNKPLLPWTEAYTHIRMEATNGESRLDACLSSDKDEAKPMLWVECKNVSLVEDNTAAFPDAVSERGLKHLETLIRIVKEGQRAAMLYVVQRTDAQCFSTADYIDIKYSQKFIEAYHAGVEIYVIIANVQKDGVYFGGCLPLAPCIFAMPRN